MDAEQAAAELRDIVAAMGVRGAMVDVEHRASGERIVVRMPVPRRIEALTKSPVGYTYRGVHVLVSTRWGVAQKRATGMPIHGAVNVSYDGVEWCRSTDTLRWLRVGGLYARASQRGPFCWRLTVELHGKVATRLVRDLNAAKLRVALVLRAMAAQQVEA